jgi:hypothetical protein
MHVRVGNLGINRVCTGLALLLLAGTGSCPAADTPGTGATPTVTPAATPAAELPQATAGPFEHWIFFDALTMATNGEKYVRIGSGANEAWANIQNTDGWVNGPPLQVMQTHSRGVHAMTEGPDGTLYMLVGTQELDMRISALKNGRVYTLVNNGYGGFRDGPAERARFSCFRRGHYNTQYDLKSDNKGTLYLSDMGNARIRRLAKNADGRWFMDTVVGGGTNTLKVGESAPATELKLADGVIHLAVAGDDLIWVITVEDRGLYRYTPSNGKATRFSMRVEGIPNPGFLEGPQWAFYNADGDRNGNAYFVTEMTDSSAFWKIAQDGKITHLAGFFGHQDPQKSIYAGPLKESYFWTVVTMTAPRGRFIYVNAGDHCVPRRIPVDGSDEPVAAVFADLTWRQCKTEHEFGRDAGRGFIVGSDRKGRIYFANGTRFDPEGK